MTLSNREQILTKAQILVGSNGEVRNYLCDCEPKGERFIVKWQNQKGPPICYNIEELKEAIRMRLFEED